MRAILGAVLATATFALAAPIAAEGSILWASAITGCGLIWWLGHSKGGSWQSSFGLVLFTATAAIGLAANLQKEAMLLGALLGLAAWDLSHFSTQLRLADSAISRRLLITAHLKHLAVWAAISFSVGWIALSVHFELSFWWILAAGLAGAVALSRAIGDIRSESD